MILPCVRVFDYEMVSEILTAALEFISRQPDKEKIVSGFIEITVQLCYTGRSR